VQLVVYIHLHVNNVKIRFNTMFDGNWNPAEIYKVGDYQKLLDGHYYNKKSHKSYKEEVNRGQPKSLD